MIPTLTHYQEDIRKYVLSFLSEKKNSLSFINKWGEDSISKLEQFATQGKLVRGSLVLFSYHLFTDKDHKDILSVAAAIELIHSALLIHDDIMDEDELRRGKKTIHAQYTAQATPQQHASTFGNNMAMCVGDMSFFFAYELLSLLSVPQQVKEQLIHLFSQELMHVCLAQMQDVAADQHMTEQDILSLYKHKTARYTFSLPLMSGALLAQAEPSVVEQLSLFGEYAGLLFQVKDDELDLFGNEDTIGKPVASDVAEGKQTLLWHYLCQTIPPEQQQQFFKQHLTQEEVQQLQELVQEKGVLEKIEKHTSHWKQEAETIIHALPLTLPQKQHLEAILMYTVKRKK